MTCPHESKTPAGTAEYFEVIDGERRLIWLKDLYHCPDCGEALRLNKRPAVDEGESE
ncbi:hypothetical protein [Hydrocarboniphaga effusa]|uniref:hypothetical protein n=1 Tax=Hydrocarboniphaga effusa TaxID=243629 RepID=UPI00398BED4B